VFYIIDCFHIIICFLQKTAANKPSDVAL